MRKRPALSPGLKLVRSTTPIRVMGRPKASAEKQADGSDLPTQTDDAAEHRLCGSLWGWLPSAISLIAVAVAVLWRTLPEPSLQPYAASAVRAPLPSCPGRTAPPEGNLYAVLGVAREFAPPQLKARYRKLALQWHPDKNEDCSSAATVFAEVSRAFTVLSNPELREVYDRLGERGLQRLQDGDPRVSKDWVPPEEVLRRHGLTEHQLQRQWRSLDDVVTNLFKYLNIV